MTESEFFFFVGGFFAGMFVLIVWSAFSMSADYEDRHQ